MNFFSKLPAGSKVLIGVVGALFPIVLMVSTFWPSFARYWMMGYAFIFAVSTLATLVQMRAETQHSNNFGRDLAENAGRTSSTSNVVEKALHADLLKQFQAGLDNYKKYDRNVYDLPWYVLVGETGSGKTEAMLRSEIGFPEKLGNLVKGVGGTISMNWWFANQAVVLDTAGKLFIQEDNPAANKAAKEQWVTFLRLLRKNRPACPINGLILVIPATTLAVQVDQNAEDQSIQIIKNRAAQMATQLEGIQTELGVRFPVYVLITKTDKIPGFRDFFSHITAKERYQIFGWSNPDDLDAPYSFAKVEEYAAQTVEKLRLLCLELLKDPVPKDLTKARFDEVDDLFTFPDNYAKMIPKLKCYLDDIFTPDLRNGEGWTTHPCFLRGIYFTSALQRGAVLNPVLARAMKKDSVLALESEDQHAPVPLVSAHTQYFLRDLFREKIFLEKGLVTKAGNIKREASSARRWVVNALLAGVGAVALMGYISSTSAPEETNLWKQVDSASNVTTAAIAPVVTIDHGVPSYHKANLKNIVKLSKLVDGRPYFGWLFAPMVWCGDWGSKRHDALETVVWQGVAGTLVETALEVLGKPGRFATQTSDADLKAVQVLVKLKAAADMKKTASTAEDGDETVAAAMTKEDAASLLTCVFGDEDLEGRPIEDEAGRIAAVIKAASGHSQWPPDNLMKPADKPSDKTNQSLRLYKVLVALLPQGAVDEEDAGTAGAEDKAVADFNKALALLRQGADDKKLNFELCRTALSDMRAAALILDKIKQPPAKGAASGGAPKVKAHNNRKKPSEILAMLRNTGENSPGLGKISDKQFVGFKNLKEKNLEDKAPALEATADKLTDMVMSADGESKYRYQQILEWLEQARSLHGDRDPDKLTVEAVKALQNRRDQLIKAAGEDHRLLVLWLLDHWADEFVRVHLKAYLRFPLVNTPNNFYGTTGLDSGLLVTLRLLDLLASRKEYNAGLRKVLMVRDLVFDFPGGDVTAGPVIGSWSLTAHREAQPIDWNAVRGVRFEFVNREPEALVLGHDQLMRECFVNAPLRLQALFKSGKPSPEFSATAWGPVQLLLSPAGKPVQVSGGGGAKWDVLLGTDPETGAQVRIEIDAKGRVIPNPDQWPTVEELSTSAS